ncbi:MAG: HAD family hydrolase [Syntrophales bacterium]|nr:HAD family hydrolase [Syntrophales bacterium]
MRPLAPINGISALTKLFSARKIIPNLLKAVLFDFDGTLASLNVDFIRMRGAVLDLMGDYCTPSDAIGDLYVLEMIEAGRKLISERCPRREGEFFARAHEVISAIETEGAREGTLLPGTEEMLRELRRRHIKTGVVTRNCRAAVVQLFPDIDSRCDAVITREGAARVKPHPDHLLTALGSLDTDPTFAAMVGDHPMDITVGKEVGVYTVGVLTGYSEAGALRQAGADLIIERASDITRYL